MPYQGAPPPRAAPAAARYVPTGGAAPQPVFVGPPPPYMPSGTASPAYPQPGYQPPAYPQPGYGYPDPYSGGMPYGMPYGGMSYGGSMYGYDPYGGYYPSPMASYGYGYPSYGGGLLGMFGRLLGNGPLDDELTPEEEQVIRYFYHAMKRAR